MLSKKDYMKLRKQLILVFLLSFILLPSFFFLIAGTVNYWHAWVYCAIILFPALFVTVYFLRKDPEFIERRMRTKEKEKPQQLFIKLGSVVFLLAYIIPGLDYRFGWSSVPVAVVLIADVIVLIGYLLIFMVFNENHYASRVIEVVKGQKVISTGPYAFVRHPMYLGALVMYLATPAALGSYWGIVAFIPLPFLLAMRILNEEDVLRRELKGYKDYMKKVRYRLVPGVW